MINDRSYWNAAAAPFTRITNPGQVQFLTVHRIVDENLINHASCIEWLQMEQLDAMDRGLPDIPWNAVCCPHGEMYDCLGVEQWPHPNDHIGEVERTVSLSLLVLVTVAIDPLGDLQRHKIRGYRLNYFGGFYPTARCISHRDWDAAARCPGGELAGLIAEMEAER